MRQAIMLLFLLVASLCASPGAYADRHYYGGGHPHGGYPGYYRGSGFGFYFGWPWYSRPYPYYAYPYYTYPYYPYYPPAVTVPSSPPVYIERPPQSTQQFPSGYWYYCDNPEGYYPYVKECPQGWQQVNPIPQR
jgi:hypothetical protein